MLHPAAASAPADDLLQAVLEISLTGIIVFRPVYDPTDPATITDLAYVHLNPAAQRMLQLPACPTETLLTRYPNAVDTGIFAFYRDSFLAGGQAATTSTTRPTASTTTSTWPVAAPARCWW